MLELLLYCHMFAKLRFASEIAVVMDTVMDLVGQADARYARWLASIAPERREQALAFGCWTERDLASALDRLNAYVASAA
jgi:hypothetical protein